MTHGVDDGRDNTGEKADRREKQWERKTTKREREGEEKIGISCISE